MEDTVGTFDSRIQQNTEMSQKAMRGVAVAMAMQDPVLSDGKLAGVRVNWGNFEGNNAFGLTFMGIIDQNVFGGGEALALSAGLGASTHHDVGVRAGLQLTW